MPDAQTNVNDASLRRVYAAGLAVTVLIASYISFVPFEFTGPADLDRIQAALRWPPPRRLVSRTDFIANVLLFVPIGFCAIAWLGRGRSMAGRAVRVVGVVGAAVALSAILEVVQAFTPSRMPSFLDIAAHTIGTVVGVMSALLLRAEIERWWHHDHGVTGSTVVRTWLTIYAAARTIVLLLPFDVTVDVTALARKFRDGMIVLDPARSPAFERGFVAALTSDLVLAAPIGVLACVAGVRQGTRRHALSAALLVIAFFAIVETAQVFVISRTADVVDLLVNLAGGLAGVALAAMMLPASIGSHSAARGRGLPIAGLGLAVVAYLAHHLAPFDFQLSVDVIRDRIGLLASVPFHGYYQNPELKALGDALIKLALAAPIGFFAGWILQSAAARYRALPAVASFVVAAAFFGVVEAGQVLLPSRYPDNSDVILALAGATIGWILQGPAGSFKVLQGPTQGPARSGKVLHRPDESR